MKNNKLISVLLTLLVCLSLVVSASATTENDLTFALESPDSSVENFDDAVVGAGETFKVQLVIKNNPGFTLLTMDVIFDNTVLELVDKTATNDAFTFATLANGNCRVNVGDFDAFARGQEVPVVDVTGTVVEFTFKAKVEVDTPAVISLKCGAFVLDAKCDIATFNVNVGELKVNILGTEHVCDANNTVEAEETAIAPTCAQGGKHADKLCAVCGKVVTPGEPIEALPHTPGEVVKENEVAPTCTEDGSYDDVTYCTVCNAETSRVAQVVTALGHTPGEIVKENEVAPTCTTTGSYDEVVYCTVCNEELSREAKTVDALGHTKGEVVKENEVAPTCTVAGSYDEVTYCTVCGEEASRETKTVAALGHGELVIVIENEVAATCTTAGSYDTVVYCTVCNEEVTRTSKTVDALGHKAAAAVKENDVAATCTTAGSYDMAVYCSACNEELSRETTTVDAFGHAWGEWKVTTESTCKDFGVQTRTCANCGEAENDEHVNLAEHTFGEWTVKTPATTEAEGVEVRTCSVCGEEESQTIAKLPVEPAPKSNALVIVIVVVVVLAGAGVAAFFVLKNKKK